MQSDQSFLSMKKVLVFGATGQQGGAVAQALVSRGRAVRGFARDPKERNGLSLAQAGVEIFVGDMFDEESIERAMGKVDAVFCVLPNSGQGAVYGISNEDEIRFGKTIVQAAQRAGVKHFVYSSTVAVRNGPTGVPHIDTKAEIEAYLRSSKIASTILRPATIMETLLSPGMGLNIGAYSFFVKPQGSFQAIAARDIGKIAATIICDPSRYLGRTIEIAGDEISGLDMQEALSRAAGKPILYSKFSDDILSGSSVMAGSAKLFEAGQLKGEADIPGLNAEFGSFLRFREWLETLGRARLEAALGHEGASLSLR